MVQVLGPLSARPPTPPKTSSHIVPHEERDRPEQSPVVFQTPGDTPLTENRSTNAPSTASSKRVNFSLWPNYIKPPTFTNTPSKPQSDLKSLPPSNERKPAKSILKPSSKSDDSSSLPNAVPETPESFAMLLESITQQLAGESISSRVDAYMHFHNALRAYEGVPSEQEMSGKLGLITQFIQRDLKKSLGGTDPLDTNLAMQALKLSMTFVSHPQILPQLSDDYRSFLLDYCVTCLQDVKVPKSIVIHGMHILGTHNFSAKIMTNARLTRLLSALHELTSRVDGNSIVYRRLAIYQHILTHSKSAIVSHSDLWVEHLLAGLLHHVKDIRLKAISLGIQASKTFGPHQALSKSMRDVLSRPIEGNRRMVLEVRGRLKNMMAASESCVHVPQVWIVVILLLRNRRSSIDQWEYFKEWALVIQSCFNCSDAATKAQAISSWNRFVFVVSPSESTSSSLLRMLRQPILAQIENRKEKGGAQLSQLALSSYYNLLYYAFRPSASHHHLDVVWHEYISLPAQNIFASVPALSNQFSQALSSLLWSQGKIWTENKVNESSKLKAEELPSIDCKWVRTRITTVLKVFESIFKSSAWVDDAVGDSPIATAWTNLSNALAHASSKEITPSGESMQAAAQMLGLLQRIWIAGPSSLNAAGDQRLDNFLARFRFISTTMISALGSIPFTEKFLLKTSDETFQATNTPTHRHSRENSNLDSPIVHLLRLICDKPGMPEPSPSYSQMVDGVLQAACSGKGSRGSRVELFRQCAELDLTEIETPSPNTPFAQITWKSTAKLTADALCSFPIESARERDGTVSRDYDNVVKILSTGLKYPNVSQEWTHLLESFVRVVRTEKGDRTIATMIIEPIAERVMQLPVHSAFLTSSVLLHQALSIPYHQEVVVEVNAKSEDGGRKLFPHKLVELVNQTLRLSYESFNASETVGIADFIESLTSLLGSGVLAFRSAVLASLQGSLAVWVKDESRRLDAEAGVESRVLTASRALSSAVSNVMQTFASHDTACLQEFETIVCAGVESTHTSVARRFMDMWSSTFGQRASLVYPESVSRALQKLDFYSKSQASGPAQTRDSRIEPGQPSSRSQEEDRSLPETSQSGERSLSRHTIGPSADLDSSPVVKSKADQIASPKRPHEPQQQDTSENHVPDSFPGIDSESHRPSKAFSIIDNLQSSSPASTPRAHAFKTPPHLRHIRNTDAGTRTPPTPTLPTVLAEGEDVFLGSSPTPGTRTRTPASDIPSAVTANTHIDPPSSPPELRPNASDAHRAESPRRRQVTSLLANSKKADNAKDEAVSERPITPSRTDTANAGGRDEPSVTKSAKHSVERRRSVKGQFVKNSNSTSDREPQSSPDKASRDVNERPVGEVNVDSSQEPEVSPDKRSRNAQGRFVKSSAASQREDPSPAKSSKKDKSQAGKPGSENNTPRSKSATKEKQSRKRGGENGQKRDSAVSDPEELYTDDVETQIASQLGQDLELAVDWDERPEDGQPVPPDSSSKSKKRKREVDQVILPLTKERRRSTRSSIKEPSAEVQQIRTIRTRRSSSAAVQDPVDKTSPAEPVLKKRKSRADPKSDTAGSKVAEHPQSAEHPKPKDQAQSASQDTAVDHEANASSEPSQKRRKSARLGGPADSQASETSPGQTKSPRNRSRKKNKNRGNKAQHSPQRDQVLAEESNGQTQEDTQHEVSDSLAGVILEQPVDESQDGGRYSAQNAGEVLAEETIVETSGFTQHEIQESPVETRTEDPARDMDLSKTAESQQKADTAPVTESFVQPPMEIHDTQPFSPNETEKPAERQHAVIEPENNVPALPAAPSAGETGTHMQDTSPIPDPISSGQTTERITSHDAHPETVPIDTIHRSLREVLDQVKSTTLDWTAFRELDDSLFKIRVETQEAWRRHSTSG